MITGMPAGLLAFYGGRTNSDVDQQQGSQPVRAASTPTPVATERKHQSLPDARFDFHEGDSRLPRPIKHR